eukprot:scaffold15816_cov51-Phaeocystis_antarctica.AAC.1
MPISANNPPQPLPHLPVSGFKELPSQKPRYSLVFVNTMSIGAPLSCPTPLKRSSSTPKSGPRPPKLFCAGWPVVHAAEISSKKSVLQSSMSPSMPPATPPPQLPVKTGTAGGGALGGGVSGGGGGKGGIEGGGEGGAEGGAHVPKHATTYSTSNRPRVAVVTNS